MMQAEGFDPGPQARALFDEDPNRGDFAGPKGRSEARGWVSRHRLMAHLKERKIGSGIADIAEVLAEPLAEGGELVVARQVRGPVRGKDTGKEAQMIGNALREDRVGCCRKINGAARGMLLFKILKEFSVIWEVSDVQSDRSRKVPFESGLALKHPPRKPEKAGGTMAR